MSATIKCFCIITVLNFLINGLEAATAVAPGPAKITHVPLIPVKGGSVILNCNIESDKALENISYRWYRGQHLLPVNVSVLSIDPLTWDSRTNYSCNAYNEAGDGEADIFYLDVKAPPSFIKGLPRFFGVMHTSGNFHLSCMVECYPQCSISWLKNGQLLKENPDLYLIESHNTQNIPSTKLYKNFEATYSRLNVYMTTSAGKIESNSIAGNYTCAALSNSIGEGIQSTTEVFVRGEQAA